MSESEATVAIKAATADGTYIYENSGLTLAAGKYYQSTVKMSLVKIVDLSIVTKEITIKDGFTVEGTLGENVKISIADGATVTLDNVSINADGTWYSGNWAGITCEGDATIILKDGSTNTVKGFDANYPGIHVPGDAENSANNTTLTIKGTGSLTASSNGYGAGIGGGMFINCGNIIIEGGTIEANGGQFGAGIGSGQGVGIQSSTDNCGAIKISGGSVKATGGDLGAGIGSGAEGNCGNILISGGTIEATGGAYAAAIGSGDEGSCGRIEITTDVTQVTAKKVSGFETIGRGGNGYCTNVSIGGTVYWNGSAYQNGGDTYLTINPIIYPAPTIGDVTPLDPFAGGGDPLAN
jgi:hypothetical protein